MRILIWNVNHRIRQKVVPPEMPDAIQSLAPDVIVLTEFVPGPSRTRFYDSLASFGLINQTMSAVTHRENHVFIASRYLLHDGDIQAPKITPSLPSNVLHVQFPDEHMEIIGLRIPDYSKYPQLRRDCWDW